MERPGNQRRWIAPAAPEAATVQPPPAQQPPEAAKTTSVMAPNVVRVPNDANADASGGSTKKRATLTYRTPRPAAAERRQATWQTSRPVYDHFWGQRARGHDARAPNRRLDPGGGHDRSAGGNDDRDD
jgi:hypothetical protein